MADATIIERLLSYLPPDRAEALLKGEALPEQGDGTVLFSDISGFTPLTEAVVSRYGPRRGGEELTNHLNKVYDALIRAVSDFSGSIIGFAGDAMTVWFEKDTGEIAVTAAIRMQRAMAQFERVELPGGYTVSLGMKVAIASGRVRRFVAGDPRIQLVDVIAGDVMERVSVCEGAAVRGEIAVDSATAEALGSRLTIKEWRQGKGSKGVESIAIVAALDREAPCFRRSLPAFPPDAAARLAPWMLPEVSRRIVSAQDVFLTELRPTAALFTRFMGIDFESDRHAPAKLDAYLRWIQRILFRLEGIMVQLTIGEKGSYFYAAWGAPIAHDDDTMRVCTAAMEIAHPPPEIAAFLSSTQVGVTCGTMRTGAYGNSDRRTYGVLGDDTNLAARLMAKAAPGEVLVSAPVHEREKEAFDFRRIPSVTVKGKKDPIDVYLLLGRRQKGILGWSRTTPMIGRVKERALVAERLRRAAARKGQVVALCGDAGTGKTRLLTEVVAEAQNLGFTAFAGDCPALGAEVGFSVWIPVWRAFFHIPDDATAHSALEIVTQHLRGIDPALSERAPLLGLVLNLPFADNELTRTLDPKVRRSSMEGLLIECLRHRGRSGPLLLVLEECHWIDEASRNLLETLVQALARLRCAILLTHRPVKPGDILPERLANLEYVSTVELGDLTESEARQLIALRLDETLGSGVPPPWLVELIATRAGGNPFFIEEVAKLLKSSGADLSSPESMAAMELPESLHSLALSRIDQLSEDAQTTLKVASVIGRLFRTAMLAGVHPLERARLGIAEQLLEFERREIAQPEKIEGEPGHVFRHVVLQEVAYQSLPFVLRSKIHESIGDFIEELAGGEIRPWIDMLAFHYGNSERTDKKRRYLVAAGHAARAAYAIHSAISYYGRALEFMEGPERVEVLTGFAEVLELAGRWDEAFARYKEAREIAEAHLSADRRAALSGAIGDLYRRRGQFSEAGTWLARARAENEEASNEAGVALMLHLEGTLCAQMGNFSRATMLFLAAAEIRTRLGDEAGSAKTLNNLGIVSRSQGKIDTALEYYEKSLAIRRKVNDRREIANSLNNLGFTRRFRKEFDQAKELLEESLAINKAIGDRWSTANSYTSLAELALDIGDAALAQQCLKDSFLINRELGDQRALAFLLEGCGRLGKLKNDMDSALLYLCVAQRLRATIGAPLEPADAATVDAAREQARAAVSADFREMIERDAQTLPIDEVLDRALARLREGDASNTMAPFERLGRP